MFNWLYEIIEAVKNFFNFSQPAEIKELDIIFDTKVDVKFDTESFKITLEELLKPFSQSSHILEVTQTDKSILEQFAHNGYIVHSYQLPNIDKFSGDLRNSEQIRHQYADSMKPYSKL